MLTLSRPIRRANSSDGCDNDGDGLLDCDDDDCIGDPACSTTPCEPDGGPCKKDGDCCSGDCQGTARNKTCAGTTNPDGGGGSIAMVLRSFLRGDCNADGAVNVADAACSLNYLFAGAAEPGCLASLNTNGDRDVNVVDPIALLNFLFSGGSSPVAPFPACGPGTLPADEKLGCANPPTCQ